MKETTLSRLWTLPQASRLLGLSQKAIRAAIERGDLKAVRLTPNGWPRISEDALRDWIAAHRMKARGKRYDAAAP